MECGGDAFAWTRSLARDSHCLEIPWITSHTIYSCSGSEFDGAPGCAVLVNAQTETGASALNLPTGPVMPRTVNGTGHTGPSEFCATSI